MLIDYTSLPLTRELRWLFLVMGDVSEDRERHIYYYVSSSHVFSMSCVGLYRE